MGRLLGENLRHGLAPHTGDSVLGMGSHTKKPGMGFEMRSRTQTHLDM